MNIATSINSNQALVKLKFSPTFRLCNRLICELTTHAFNSYLKMKLHKLLKFFIVVT